jgi:3-dehydroquinate dehydratase-1
MKIALKPRSVVATVHTAAGLSAARELRKQDADLIEIRADALSASPGQMDEAARKFRLPVILTVRDPAEGGVGNLSPERRLALFEDLMPRAALIDVELKNAARFAPLIAAAMAGGKGVILSHHDFESVPSAARCGALLRRAAARGATIFKIAATPGTPGDLAPLLALLSRESEVPVAAVAMGPLGKAARLLFAQCGSALTYGYVDRSNAPGQWEAASLKARIAELAG